MPRRHLFYPPCLNSKALILIFASALTIGCSGGSTADGLLQGPTQNSQQTNPLGNNAQPAAQTLPEDSFLLTVAQRQLIRVSPVTGDSEVLYASSSSELVGPPDVVGNYVLIGDDNNSLKSINLDTGELDWEFGFSDANGSTSSVVCADPVCYTIDAGGLLFAIDVRAASLIANDDALLWEADLHTNFNGSVDSFQKRPLLVQGDYIYATTNYRDDHDSSTIQILNRETGVLVHTIALGEIALGPPVIKDDLLLVPALTSLRAYRTNSYELIWQTDFDGSNGLWGTNDIALAGNIAVISSQDSENQYDSEGRVFVGLNVNTGEMLWTANAGTIDYRFSPQTDGTTVYSLKSKVCFAGGFRCTQGTPLALNPLNGDVLWDSSNLARREPLVAAGSLYFASLHASRETHFSAMDKATAEVNFVAPRVSTTHTLSPILVSDGKVYRRAPFPSYKP